MATVSLRNVMKIYPYSGDDEKAAKKRARKNEGVAKTTNLQITDKGVVAVQQFNLEIADKEFIVLVGPSGCGKSTTLRMVAGLEEITEGELWIGNKLVNDVAPKDRDIAMVFQNYALYPHMTVYDNMAFALKLRKTPKGEIDKKVKQAAEILEITEYLGRKPTSGRLLPRQCLGFLLDKYRSTISIFAISSLNSITESITSIRTITYFISIEILIFKTHKRERANAKRDIINSKTLNL